MKISVALATWRGTAHLGEQLDSLSAQTRLPDELIAVDDASGDETAAMLDDFAVRAPFPVRVLRNEKNLGYAANFGRALSECTGDLVLPCDQDDVWFADKLEQFEDWAQSYPDVQIFACDAELTDGALTPSGRTKRGQIAAVGLPEAAFVMGCCLAVRQSFLTAALPIPQTASAHDTWLVELADHFDLVQRRPEVLQYYRQHGANTSDFMANTPDRIGFAQQITLRTKSILRRMQNDGGLLREHKELRLQADRIAQQAGKLVDISGPERFTAGASRVNGRLADLEARIAVRGTAPLSRPMAIARLSQAGTYGRTGGVKGALRDLTTSGRSS